MPEFTARANDLVTVTVRVDKRPYLAGFQTAPRNSNWQDIQPDADGMGESRRFRMPASPRGQVVQEHEPLCIPSRWSLQSFDRAT